MIDSRKKTGRPRTRPVAMRDGFYIEVRNRKSDNSGIKLRRDTYESMLQSAESYSRTKHVIILGELKDTKWLSEAVEVE